MTSEYKVSSVGKSREHLVKFEGSTETVTCSCMKFTFVGILCAHALKVIDKKNIKRIPSQYIMKRWTRDAKARSIINYHVIKSNDSPKESMGKRYSNLCRNFREIATLAAEHEKLSAYAHERSLQLLKDLELMKKTLSLDDGSIGDPLANYVPKEVYGVQRKATVGRPRGRLKSSLEKRRRKSHIKSTTTPNSQHVSIKDSTLNSGNSFEQSDAGCGIQTADVLTQQESCIDNGSNAPLSTDLESMAPLSNLSKNSQGQNGTENWA
ncbi:protein FAR1-RELATED SEQUENCE 9-like [Cornus florida]|uniref:protein FAR1-RELATED SEQUENCE 9-like n=1 Tax=Cornus florida TaxID=4283 RepID=UPI0028967386|nr:protein FAR1-RELATED SEQUENCE 9-like [Cornus florida]